MINLLDKFSFVSTAVDFVKTRFRLVVEYILIAIVVSLLATAFTFYVEKLQGEIKLERVTTKAELLDNANSSNLAAIEQLRQDNMKNNVAMRDLMKRNQAIQTEFYMAQQKLDQLETTDEKVSKYLNTPIPDSLQCLLNAECATGIENGSSKGTSP